MAKIYTFPLGNDIPRPTPRTEYYKTAGYILIRLQPSKSGDIAAILNLGCSNDQEAVAEWVSRQKEVMTHDELFLRFRVDIGKQIIADWS